MKRRQRDTAIAATHDNLFDARIGGGRIAGMTQLPCYLFNSNGMSECNGIWAIVYAAENLAHAKQIARSLIRGRIPKGVGIYPANETTEKWLQACRHEPDATLWEKGGE